MEQQSLWASVIVSIYGADGGLSDTTVKKATGLWGAIIKDGLDIDKHGVNFTQSFKRKLGDGSCIKFWTDRWLEAGRLCVLFRRLFALEQHKDCVVKERLTMTNKGVLGTWC